jgi:hypothetical protein
MSAKSAAIPDVRYAKTIHGPVTFAVRPNQPWQIHFFIKSSLVSARLFSYVSRCQQRPRACQVAIWLSATEFQRIQQGFLCIKSGKE